MNCWRCKAEMIPKVLIGLYSKSLAWECPKCDALNSMRLFDKVKYTLFKFKKPLHRE